MNLARWARLANTVRHLRSRQITFRLYYRVTQYRLAKEIGVPQRRIGEIGAGKRAITADTAARLGVFFGMDAEFWLNLQAHHDLVHAREALAERLAAHATALAA